MESRFKNGKRIGGSYLHEEHKTIEIIRKKVELATTNPKYDSAVEELKEAKEALRIAQLQHTPLFSPASSSILKCHQGDELFPCHNIDSCSLCRKPEKAKEGSIPRGHHLGEDPAVWVCDRWGHPKVVGCRCPKCTDEQGCKYFYYWELGAGFPIIGKEKIKGTWLASSIGYTRGIKIEKGQIHYYTIRKVMPSGIYEEVPDTSDIGMCRECLFWDSRLQCPAHIGGEGYWVLKRHYPLYLEWAIATYKPQWDGIEAPMLLKQRNRLADARNLSIEETMVDADREIMKERLKAIYSHPPAKPHRKTANEELEERLRDAVIAVDKEYKAKGRTNILTK